MERKVDNYHRMAFYNLLNHRWLGIHMLGVGNVVCASTALVRSIFKGAQSAALLGLGTTFSMEINGCMGWFVILQSLVETEITSVDRITQYINTPNEAEWRNKSSLLQAKWPDKGKLEFRNYSLRYRLGLDLVLRNISFIVKGGEKIGVVGRTGAGKSSLILSLFRLVEPAEGTILIDGVDITDIGLHDLRDKLAIIPQDPVLFTGSLRMNLDPQVLYTDQDIWTALNHTHLRQFVESLPEGLQFDCGEGGNNFSVGQRQLFCLARTLLRKSKVLVLDEATAAVDMETDDLIQETIRSEFKTCTVLTIAHRLNTVMDYDRILVLDHGEVIEFDTPTTLLQSKGVFHQMTIDAGLITKTQSDI